MQSNERKGGASRADGRWRSLAAGAWREWGRWRDDLVSGVRTAIIAIPGVRQWRARGRQRAAAVEVAPNKWTGFSAEGYIF